MRRLSALLIALLLLGTSAALPHSALAQNSAEGKARPRQAPVRKKAAKDKGTDAKDSEAESKDADAKDSAAQDSTKSDSKDDSAVDAKSGDSDDKSAAGNAAEGSAKADDSADGTKPTEGDGATAANEPPAEGVDAANPLERLKGLKSIVDSAAGNAAEGGAAVATVAEPGGAANAAEQPVSGGSAGNTAEGQGLGIPGIREPDDLFRDGPAGLGQNRDNDHNGIAEPPLPEMILPAPAEVAGATAGYQPPDIDLMVPSLQPIPAAPGDKDYVQPERVYLGDRPLPALDETETDQERIAKSIENSLKLIQLDKEQRPPEGVEIPLAAHTATFKAADAFQFDRRNRILTFSGNAEIIIADIAIWADLIEINDSAATTYAKGYVALQRQDDILYCDEAYMNYDTGTLELFYVEGNTGGPKTQGTVYFTADRAYGSFDRLIMEHVEVTTCSPFCGGPKEAHLGVHKAIYKRNTSIVLHDVWIYARESRIGYVPVLAFPLRKIKPDRKFQQQESEVQQNYGRNRSEGWFAKFAYTYSTRYVEGVSNPLLGVAKLDLTQKQGPGIGVRQDFYTKALGVTTVRADYQRQWEWLRTTKADGTKSKIGENYNFELDQELNLSRYLTGSLSIDRSNHVVPATRVGGLDSRTNTWTNNLRLNYANGDTKVGITADQRINISGGQTSSGGSQSLERQDSTLNASLNLDQAISDELKFTFTHDYSAIKGNASQAGIPADQEGNMRAELNFTGKQGTPREGYQSYLRYNKQGIDFDRDKNNTSQDARRTIRREIPSFQLTLPRDLIAKGAYFQNFQINLDNLVSGTRRRQQNAFRAKVTVGGRDSIEFSGASKLDTSLDFAQYWYDDSNAQYTLAPRLNYRYDAGTWIAFGVNYQLNYRQGVRNPPVEGDRTFYDNRLGWDVDISNHRSWKWELRGGWDFEHLRSGTKKRSWPLATALSSSFSWDPNDTFTLQHAFSYDWGTRTWRPTNISARWRSAYVRPDGYYNWYLATRIEAQSDYWNLHHLNTIDTVWYKNWGSGWSTELTTSYRHNSTDGTPADLGDLLDDFVKKIVVRKVNCCTTLEGGWRTGINEVYFNVFLNALPQYPSTLDTRQPFDDDMDTQLLFPTQGLINDIQSDVFGTNIPLGLFGIQ